MSNLKVCAKIIKKVYFLYLLNLMILIVIYNYMTILLYLVHSNLSQKTQTQKQSIRHNNFKKLNNKQSIICLKKISHFCLKTKVRCLKKKSIKKFNRTFTKLFTKQTVFSNGIHIQYLHTHSNRLKPKKCKLFP